MKIVKLIMVCLLTSCFFCCNARNQRIVDSEDLISEFTKVYTMRKQDSTVIGDVYVKFENDSLFRHLYVIQNTDTLYSIMENIFFYGDGRVDMKGSTNIYGYTFYMRRNDYFCLTPRFANGEYVTDDAIIGWNYEKNIIEFFKTP